MRLRRAKGETPSVLIAGSLAIGSSLLGAFRGELELLANALGGSLSSLLGSSVGAERTLGRVFGDRAAFTGGGRGRWHSAAVEQPVHRLDPHLGPRRGWIHPWRSERLVPRLVGARRLAAPACPIRPSRRAAACSRLHAAATRRRGDGRATPRLEAPDMFPYYYASLPISYPRVRTIRSGSADEPPSEK